MPIPPSWSPEAQQFFRQKEVRSLLHASNPRSKLHFSEKKDRIVSLRGSRWRCWIKNRNESTELFRNRLSQLIAQLQSCPELHIVASTDRKRLSKDERYFQKRVQMLFFRKIALLGPEYYAPSSLMKGPSELFGDVACVGSASESWDLIYCLEPKLRDHHRAYALVERRCNDALRRLEESCSLDAQDRMELISQVRLFRDTQLLTRLQAEAALAERLGSKPRIAKGTTGTQLLCGVEGLLGVRKFPTDFGNLRKRFEVHFGQLSKLSCDCQAQIQAEVFAYRIALMSNLSEYGVHVPPSVLEYRHHEEKSVFMMSIFLQIKQEIERKGQLPGSEEEVRGLVIEGREKLAHYLVPENTAVDHPIDEAILTRLQVFAGYDYYLFNLDRHRENWMIYYGEGEASVEELGLIDSANIMPCAHGTRYSFDTARSNLLTQRHLFFARQPLTEAARVYYRRLAEQQLNHILMAVNDLPAYLKPEMLELFSLRGAVIAKAALDPEMSFFKLAKFDTTALMREYLVCD